MLILNPLFSVFSSSDIKYRRHTLEAYGFLSKNSSHPSPSNSRENDIPRKLPVRQLLMSSSGCGAKKCAQHQITSYVYPCRSTVKELDPATHLFLEEKFFVIFKYKSVGTIARSHRISERRTFNHLSFNAQSLKSYKFSVVLGSVIRLTVHSAHKKCHSLLM